MDFQARQLTIISLASGILLIFSGLLQSKSGSIDGQILATTSQRNLEAFDYILLNRKAFSGNESAALLSAKKLMVDELDDKISTLVKESQTSGRCLAWLTISIVWLNLSTLFPVVRGNELRSSKMAFSIYCVIMVVSLITAVVALVIGNFVVTA